MSHGFLQLGQNDAFRHIHKLVSFGYCSLPEIHGISLELSPQLYHLLTDCIQVGSLLLRQEVVAGALLDTWMTNATFQSIASSSVKYLHISFTDRWKTHPAVLGDEHYVPHNEGGSILTR